MNARWFFREYKLLVRSVAPFVLAFAAALGLALCGSDVLAQSGAGSIEGTVTDATGAVIPGASIQVVNQATGVKTDTKSNGAGFYQVPSLFTGTYDVTVAAPGFKTYTTKVELLVAQNANINPVMTAGAVTQQVTVSGNAIQLVTTDDGTISATLENARINQLPMNGRDISTLVQETTPGLENCPSGNGCSNGQQGEATDFEVDGVSLKDMEFGGTYFQQSQLVDPDSIQEVRVETSASSAQYASPTTAVMGTKSGTNQLHGSLFETARNNAFGIARSRSNPSNYAAPQYIRNEFGISAGGPIVLPHVYHGKDKSFWFFAYERYSLAQNSDVSMQAPTLAMRAGDFSGLVNASGVLQELYDPDTTVSSTSCAEPASAGTAKSSNKWCRTPFGGNPATGSKYNYIPSSRESPMAVVFNAMTPLPTNAENPAAGYNNLVQRIPTPTIEPQITFRLDHVFSEKNRAFLRYTQNLTSQAGLNIGTSGLSLATTTASGAAIPAETSNLDIAPNALFASAIGFTHIFSPTFVSETNVAMTQFYAKDGPGVGADKVDFESELGLPNNFGELGFPYVENIYQPLLGSQYGYTQSTKNYNFDEDLTKTIGKHQLLFGGEYRLVGMGLIPQKVKDILTFSGQGTGLENPSSSSAAPAPYSNTGNVNADEYIGSPASYTATLNAHYLHVHQMEFDGYLQDNYRVKRNLMLNLGLRYEAHPATFYGNQGLAGIDFATHGLVLSTPIAKLIADGYTTQAIISNDELDGVKFETPAEAGVPPMLMNNYDFNFLPRLGFAWLPFGKWGTVVRAGVGKYLFAEPMRATYAAQSQNPFEVPYTEDYTNAQYAPDSLQDYQLRSVQSTSPSYSYTSTLAGDGTPVLGVNTANAINTTSTTAIAPGIQRQTLDRDYAPSWAEEANFTIEQPMKWNSALRISYVYTRGGNLRVPDFYNEHPSELAWELQEGVPPPSSSAFGPTNASTGEGPYDQITWPDNNADYKKVGWSNYNALQASYQKLYHGGIAWQVMYVWSKSLRTGTESGVTNEDAVGPYSAYRMSYVGDYVNAGADTVTYAPELGTLGVGGIIAPNLPPPPPAGVPVWGYYKALNRWANYMVDTANPPQHLQFNALVDLPFGHDKRWLGNVNKGVNEVVGGWKLAGAGSITGQDFPINTTNFGPTASPGSVRNSLHVYKKNMPITDCRSGVCLKSYEWFNGYLPPTVVSGNTCAAQSGAAVVSGLKSSWVPYETPIDTGCTATSTDKYFGDNDVIVNGVTGQNANAVIGYADLPGGNNDSGVSGGAIDVTNPFAHTTLNGPMNFEADASLFKVFPITERVNFRLNLDAFNVFNIQGTPNPSGNGGVVCITPGGLGCTSYNTARQLQFTARLSF